MQLLELRKDINSPKGYWRAGTQKSLKQWEELFGRFNKWTIEEWFYDMSKPIDFDFKRDLITEVINEVFEKRQLRSLTYKDAAREVALKVLIRTQNDEASVATGDAQRTEP